MSNILVIIGSTRARRIGPAVAAWVAELGRAALPASFELVDLRDWPLPMDAEPGIPAMGEYAFAQTQAWSRKVGEADAFVFVTPQYNWGYPAPLKNALDHLYREWSGKPAMIVTYGSHGGGKCAAQLRQVLEGLHMAPVEPMPGLKLGRERVQANSGAIDPVSAFADHLEALGEAFADLGAALRQAG